MWHIFSINWDDYYGFCIGSEERQCGAVERGQAYELNGRQPLQVALASVENNFAGLLGKTKAIYNSCKI